MSGAGLSASRLATMREVPTRHVAHGDVPGLVALVARRGQVHAEAIGTTESGGGEPMRRDAIFRIASVSKLITAAAAMILVEECRLRLDDPVDDLLPELAERKVLTRVDAQLDDTVPVRRAITVRDLLTFLMGLGIVMAPRGTHPIQRAMDEAGLTPGVDSPSIEPDEWMKRLGSLPPNDLSAVPGRFGWNGGTGTSFYVDPAEELIGILLTQREMTSPVPPAVFRDFWTCAYQAIED